MPDITVHDPRTGEILYTIDEPTDEQIAQAYDSARAAYSVLRAMPVRERLNEVRKLRLYLAAHKEEIARQIARETGKSLVDALMLEIFPALDTIAYYEQNAERILADQKVKTPIFQLGKKSRIFYEPLGPVLIISPWNYPFHLSFIPFICAFVAGNSVILKPSRFTPLQGLYESIVENSGFLKDGIQVVYATRKSANKLIDAKPAKIFFTGSVGAGRHVMARAAEHLIPVELELGGKDAMIVFDDVNIERTVNGALWGGMANSGQTCTSIERIYVQDRIHDRFVAALKEKAAKLRTLASVSEETEPGDLDMGCMTAEFQIEEIERQLEHAVQAGAHVVLGGAREPGSHVFPPTIVTDVDPAMPIIAEETFGPVVTITRFKTEDEAVEHANNSPLGLAGSVWSADLDRAVRVARRVVTGNVSINGVLATQANSGLPFGGIKESGFGRYRGPFGLHAFSNIKSVVIDKQSGKNELNWYPYSREKYRLFCDLINAAFTDKPLALLRTAVAGLKLELLARKRRL
ncbi:MAG: aldehyde dehydrogenase family protein [Candidatus Hydrogenedentes bacterium]|nr:aldehyde dehydrogenase family protein [Candidatus Hydrogenedentota bacterium]